MQNNSGQHTTETITEPPAETDAAPYLKALEIPQSPYTTDVVPQSFYLDAAREQTLNQLLHLAHSSGLLLVVSAEDGSGKSTLLKQFQQRAAPALRCCPILAAPTMGEQQLLAKLAACMDLPDNLNKVAILELLDDQASILQRNDLLPVILVDDAHNLPADTLDLLLQLQRNEHGNEENTDNPWRIVLFTKPTYTAELMQLNVRMHFIHLPLMDQRQLGKYLFHRLRMAGYKQESPFTAKDIAFIHKHAQGSLTRAHRLAHEVLLEKYTQTTKPVEQKKMDIPRLKIKPGVWISIIIVGILSTILFFQERINKVVDSANETEQSMTQQRLELPVPHDYILKKLPDVPPKLLDITRKPQSSATTVDEQQANIQAPAIEQPRQAEQVEDKVAAASTQPVTEAEQSAIQETAANSTEKAIAAQPPAAAEPTTATDENASAVTLATMLKRHNINGKSWIMEQTPEHITAQLIASSTPDTLLRLANNKALQGNAAIYHILRKNKDWYVLVYGSYPNKETTRKAVNKLPANLRKGQPWLRTLAAVQAEVKAGKK